MVRRAGLGLLWLGFVVYAFGFAPPNQPNTFDLIMRLSSGQWEGINPAVVALFNLMGIWPLVYAAMVLIDGQQQSFPAWPFVVGSFGVGAFLLLPYLILRTPSAQFDGPKGGLISLLDSRWLGWGLTAIATLLIGYGLIAGDWSDFAQQWQTSRFIHVMSLDFCLLCGLVPALLGDDMARRGLKRPAIFWTVTLLPLIGPSLYLALRPPLPADQPVEAAAR